MLRIPTKTISSTAMSNANRCGPIARLTTVSLGGEEDGGRAQAGPASTVSFYQRCVEVHAGLRHDQRAGPQPKKIFAVVLGFCLTGVTTGRDTPSCRSNASEHGRAVRSSSAAGSPQRMRRVTDRPQSPWAGLGSRQHHEEFCHDSPLATWLLDAIRDGSSWHARSAPAPALGAGSAGGTPAAFHSHGIHGDQHERQRQPSGITALRGCSIEHQYQPEGSVIQFDP